MNILFKYNKRNYIFSCLVLVIIVDLLKEILIS